MFRTKKDVERHVSDVLSKINSENEKNLRGYTFARLYFQVKDYETAKKYLSGFLGIRDHHAPAHKLMAQIYEVTNNAENALQSYKRSLEIDSHQTDIVLKICELYCQLSVDHETARYWADRAEQLFPHNEIVFKLRECLVSAEGEPNHQELEKLIATELEAQPKNIGLRVRLLRLYLDTERVKEAYNHATMIESKRLFPHSVEWYYLLGDIFEAFQEESELNLDTDFYMNYLSALDRLILLTLAEPHAFSSENEKKQYSVNDAAAVLLTFDQLLKKACDKKITESSWTYFIHHMKGQLYYYLATLLMKRAKMDQGNRKEALRFSAGLAVVCYTFKPVNLLQEIWFSHLEDNQKAFTNYFQQGCLRTSFIGHIITDMCKEDKNKWLQKLKLDVCINQVKERIYSRALSSVVEKDKLLSSYFLKDSTFENSSLEFPSEVALQEYDKAAYKLCPHSLHHLIWLELHRQSATGSKFHENLSEVFKGLQYSNTNLSKGSCESLCILDIEAYLYASVYQALSAIEKKSSYPSPKTQDSQLSFTPDIADPLCSKQQASWWKAAYGLHACTIKDKLGETRRDLSHGLEVIRGVGNHGMEVMLIVHLARMFADKADFLMKEQCSLGSKNKKLKPDNVSALQQRAIHYWNIALGILEKMSSGQTPRIPKEQMFIGFNKMLSKDEIKTLQEDGQLYIAVNLMDSEKLDEAADILSKLDTPYGSYYLALTLKRLASMEDNFSHTKSVLLTKAKNSIHETMDRIKDDKNHPLNKEIYLVLEDIETELGTYRSMNDSQNDEDLDEVDTFYGTPELNNSIYTTPNSHKHSTPRPSIQFTTTKPKTPIFNSASRKHFEPSPERLDAQIRALSLNQETIVKTLIDQQKAFMETNTSFTNTLKQNTEVLEQLKKLLEELKVSDTRGQARGSSRKHSYAKGQGEEEEYNDYDPNILEFYTEDRTFYNEERTNDYQNPGYSYNPSSRMVRDAATAPLNYVIPPAIPPGPPPLNHYNYQYPPHAVLPPPPVEQRPPYYHPSPGQGLPFSEGQQLPQFQFHVATPVVKHPPPVMANMGNISQPVQLPPPAVNMQPAQPVIPPPNTPLSIASPWTKTSPHAFQIPLPPPAPFAPGIPPPATQSELKNLLKMPPPSVVGTPFSQSLPTVSMAPTSSSNYVSIFAGISKTPEFNKLDRSRCDSENTASPDIDGDLEKEVMGDFKPLIPLPAEIVVETGEENEVVLFEDRAKLYRFVDQEWKERGTGIVKILHHNASGRVRLLMRRDQVLKVCANHYMSSNMEIKPLKSSDRAWTWVAQDFADEVLRPEHFCIRFKTAELATSFKAAFDKALNIVKETESKGVASPRVSVTDSTSITPKGFGSQFLPKVGSWSCPSCYVSNAVDKLSCVACDTRKPSQLFTHTNASSLSTSTTSGISMPATVTDSTSISPKGFGSQFLPKAGSWSCPSCYVSNAVDKLSCVACDTRKPSQILTHTNASTISTSTTSGISMPVMVTDNTFSTPKGFGSQFLPKAGSWSCPSCYVSNAVDKLSCVACDTRKPSQLFTHTNASSISTSTTSGISMPATVPNPIVSFKATSNENQLKFSAPVPTQSSKFFTNTPIISSASTTQNVFGGFTFSSSPMICEAEEPDVKEREILVVSTKAKNGPQVSKVNQPTSSPFSGFSFGKSPTSSSILTVQISDTSRNVTVTPTPFTGFPPKPFASTATTFTTNTQSSTISTGSSESSLSKMQSMVQNVKPLFGFESKSSKTSSVSFADESQKVSTDFSTSFGTTSFSQELSNSNKLSTDGSPEEFVPTAEFKPVVPLPALVDIKTGEEEEEKLFEERAKLFRYDANSKEWKERGTGELKILYPKHSHKYRILMRRDQVHKICANHYILPEMKLEAKEDKSWVWFAQDFSEEDLVQQQFAVRFKTTDIAKRFQVVFLDCQKKLNEAKVIETATEDKCKDNSAAFEQFVKFGSAEHVPGTQKEKQKPLSELFKHDVGSWECKQCYVRNKSGDSKCVSCESPNPSPTILQQSTVVSTNSTVSLPVANQTSGFGDLFKLPVGSWECKSCYVRNSADKTKCVSCETDKSGSSTTKSSSFLVTSSTPTTSSSNAFGAFKFGSPNTSKPTFSFGAPKTSGEFVFGMRPVTQPATFSFGHSAVSNKENEVAGFKPSLPSSNAASIFGETAQKMFGEKNSKSEQSVFGSSSAKFSFGELAASQESESETQGFKFGSPQKYEFNFPGVRPRSPSKAPKSPRSPATPSDADEEDEGDSDADNIYFQPVIPLPPKVEVKTGEEEENVLFCKRAKLFRFCSSEWKERGIGDIKVLHDEKTNRVRLLMRREQVLKVCLNHQLTNDITFEWRNDKSLSWAATDFSENEPSPELFAVRFKTSELAEEFKSAIDDGLKRSSEPAPSPKSESVTLKPATTLFSFKTDAPAKVESPFSFGSLSTRFGSSTQQKSSVFGSATSGFSFRDTKESYETSPPFSFSLNDKASTSSSFTKLSVFGGLGVTPIEIQDDGVTPIEIQDDDIKVVYEPTIPPEKVKLTQELQLPKFFYLYENKPPCPGCIGCEDIIPPYKVTESEEIIEKASPADENVPQEVTTPTPESDAPFLSSKFDSFSFSQIASNSSFQELAKSSPSGKNVFAGAGTPLFQNLNTSAEDGGDEVAQGPDIHFEPVIPMPDLIEVKTGEEDETPIFVYRAKLFRYDPNVKQWKERGIGDIKILSHNEKMRFRIILRRDQVHNVACNHCITEEMSLTPLATSENAVCWTAMDYSDNQGEATQFAVRFKHKEQTMQFKEIFLNCQEKLRNHNEKTPKEEASAAASQPNPETSLMTTPAEASGGASAATAEESESDEEAEELIFDKRISFEIYDEAEETFKGKGMGNLKIVYDDSSFGYRVYMENDKGALLCDHLIAVQTCLRTEGKSAVWAAIDMAVEPAIRRQFRATFSSMGALNEFSKHFEEGKEIAIKSPIVEKSD